MSVPAKSTDLAVRSLGPEAEAAAPGAREPADAASLGSVTDEQFLAEKESIERQLMLVPDHDKLRLFDGQRKVVVTMAENLDRETPAQRREFVLLLLERAIAYDKAVQEIRWVAAARPFFGQETARLESGVVAGAPGETRTHDL